MTLQFKFFDPHGKVKGKNGLYNQAAGARSPKSCGQLTTMPSIMPNHQQTGTKSMNSHDGLACIEKPLQDPSAIQQLTYESGKDTSIKENDSKLLRIDPAQQSSVLPAEQESHAGANMQHHSEGSKREHPRNLIVPHNSQTKGSLDYKPDFEYHETEPGKGGEYVSSADMAGYTASHNNRHSPKGSNDSLHQNQVSEIIGEEEIDGTKFYAIAGTSSLVVGESLEPSSILAWNEKLEALLDINKDGIKQGPADEKRTKRKKGPNPTPEMHSKHLKRARNDDGEEKDLKASLALTESDTFIVEQLVLHRKVKDGGNDSIEYLVQWEGDWPEDQKYTWEPEGNIIDVSLVGNYWRSVVLALRP